MRRVASDQELVLDEIATVATAQKIGDKVLCFPVFKPTLEPWLDLELVIDESISMQIWRQTIKELEKLLKNYGIFRDVRVWGLMTDDNQPIQIRRGIGASSKNQSPRSPKELIDPSGRRLVLVVSDCVSSDLWRSGKVTPVLELWAKQGSMAIIQMLPKWMWKRTALGKSSEVRLQGLNPGVFNQNLIAQSVSLWDELDGGVKVPVFTLEPDKAGNWAQMLAGKGSIWVSGYVFKLDTISVKNESELLNLAPDLSAEHRVQGFRVTASPMARKLAGLLASAPVITLPIVRLIQETFLKDSLQVNVAEVFLGGLLKPLSEINAETNPDSVQYGFMEGVRELLLDSVPSDYVLNVIHEVSKYVGEKLGFSLQDFGAVLKKEQSVKDSETAEEIGYFATVTAQVLRRLGGEYAKFAEELEGDNRVDLSTDVETIEPLPDIEYRLGGTLHSDENSYIKRQADEDLYNALKAGNYCIISAPRQMGKSSLILRVMNRLKNEGFACARIDLSGSGFNITKEQWYAGLIQGLIRYFPNLEENFDWQKWRENREKLSANKRFKEFIETVLLKQINENITIILDEFDCIFFNLDSSMIRDFLSVLKYFYERKAIDNDYSRLNFVLSGVYLLRNQTLSPIANIAQEIKLKEFTYEEALPLAGGLAEKMDNPQELLKYILEWTGGQPFLTQKLCSLVKESKQSIPNGTEKDWLDNLVRTQIIENWKFQDSPIHLKSIEHIILSDQKPEVLNLYESILQGKGDFDRVNEALQTLMSTGLVIRYEGKLRVANPIYADVFNLQWVKLNLAKFAKDFYVERPPVESNCYKAILKPGALIRIKGAHQMGKTLLLQKIGIYAEEQGYKTAFINFQLPVDSVFNDYNNFIEWFSYAVTNSLSLSNKLDEYWDDYMDTHSNCTDYFEDYILNQIETPIVLCLDELGRIFDYPEIAQSFLMLLRSWHQKNYEMDKRSIHWKKLRLVLSLSTEMYILQPMPINHSPLNLGFSIELREFSLAEVRELVQRYGLNLTVFQIEQLISLVGGHPYLIQIAVKSITEQNLTLDIILEQASTEEGVYSSHLREKFFTLHQNPDLLAAFKEVISREDPIKLESIVEYKLDAVGLVKFIGNKVIARNNLYRLYFLDKLSDL